MLRPAIKGAGRPRGARRTILIEGYPLYFTMAAVTVVSPGPGVLLTVTNAIRHGIAAATIGILGIACGTLLVAAASAAGLGVLLASSPIAFHALRLVGATYLIYLGVKLWRAPGIAVTQPSDLGKRSKRHFARGFTMQLTNPKAVFFFVSAFPQFIDYGGAFVQQLALMATTYSFLVIGVHFTYACLAESLRPRLSSNAGGLWVNRFGGGTFTVFGIALALAER